MYLAVICQELMVLSNSIMFSFCLFWYLFIFVKSFFLAYFARFCLKLVETTTFRHVKPVNFTRFVSLVYSLLLSDKLCISKAL